MLNHWYFGCCVNMSRTQIEFLLAAMKVLEQPDDNYSLLKITYCELAKADIWTRAYAIAAALEARRMLKKPEQVNTDLKNLCESFGPFLPDSICAAFSSVVAIICSENYSNIESNISMFADIVISQGTRNRTRLETPYLDSELFLPEILLLSLLIDGRKETRLLIDKPNIIGFVNKARKNKWGRHAFCLASILTLKYPMIFSLAEFQEEIKILFGHRVALEPDLAKIEMHIKLKLQNLSENTEAAGWLIQELQQFANLYHYKRGTRLPDSRSIYRLESREPKSGVNERHILERIGLFSSISDIRTWGLLCRYWAWLKIYMILAPERLAFLLRKEWVIDNFEEPRTFNIEFPTTLNNYQRKQVSEAFSTLVQSVHLPIMFDSIKSSPIPFANITKSLFSPWFPAFGVIQDQRVERIDNKSFLRVSKYVWLRMAIASWLAADLLRLEKEIGESERRFLGRFVAHSATKLQGLRAQLNKKRKWLKLKDFQGIDEWHHHQEALMDAARDYVMRVGAGLYKSVGPDVFMDSNDTETTAACILFVQYGYVQSKELEGPEKWQTHLPNLINRFRIVLDQGRNGALKDDRLLPALLRRYLLSPDQGKLLQQEEILPDNLLQERALALFKAWDITSTLNSRWFLLLTKEKTTKKIKEQLRDYDMDFANPAKRGRLLQVSVLQYLIVQVWQDQIEKGYYREKLLDNLWRVDEKLQADRFLRLLVLEMLQSPLVVNDEILQRTMAFFILEWGTGYDLRILIEKMFIPHDQEARLGLSKANRNANRALFRALLRYRGMVDDDDERGIGAIHPWHIILDSQRQEVVEQGILSVLNAAWSDNSKGLKNGSGYLLEMFDRHNCNKQKEKCHGLSWRSIDLTQYIQPNQIRDTIAMSVGVIMDQSNERMLYMHDPSVLPTPHSCPTDSMVISKSTTVNLFTSSSSIHNLFYKSSERTIVLAVVMEIKYVGQGKALVYFNIGAERIYITAMIPFHQARFLKHGDCGRIEIERDQNNKWKYCQNSWKKHDSTPSCYDTATLSYCLEPNRPLRITLKNHGDIESPDWKLWSPDIAGFLKRSVHSKSAEIFCRCIRGYWEPCPSGALDLLDSFWRRNALPIGVVAFVQNEECETQGNTHGQFWRFALSENEHFLLSPLDFSPQDAEYLENFLASHDDKHGILVTLLWNEDSQRFELLRQRPINHHNQLETIFTHYPGINLPLDDRNLRWRSLFIPGDRVIVEPKNPFGYQISLPDDKKILGLPDIVDFEVINKPRQQYEFEAKIKDWSEAGQRSCTARGDALYTPYFSFGKQDKQNLLKSWINLANGDIIQLRKTRSWPHFEAGKNLAICETTFNVPVYVEASSLSMQPWTSKKSQKYSDPAQGRLAQVTKFIWWRLRVNPQLDISGLPKGDLPDKIEGVLTTVLNIRARKNSCVVFWQYDGRFSPKPVKIHNWMDLKIRDIGYKIVGKKNSSAIGGWCWEIFQPEIHAKALWREAEKAQDGQYAMYAGITPFEKNKDDGDSHINRPVAEVTPGIFKVLDALPDVAPLSQWQDDSYIEGLTQQTNLIYFKTNRHNYSQAILKWGEMWLPVIVRQTFPDKECVYASNITILLSSVASTKPVISADNCSIAENYYSINTVIDVICRESDKMNQEYQAKQMAEKLTQILKEGKPVTAEIRNGIAFLKGHMVPASGRLSNLEKEWPWTSKIKIEEDQPTYITFFEYDCSDSNVLLYETAEGCLAASCKRVKPITLAQYENKYVPKGGKEYHPMRPLIYVMPHSVLEKNEEDKQKNHYHLFEWGYGCTIEVPEEHLLYKGQAFSTASLLVWHGDKIVAMAFQHLEPNAGGKDADVVLNITQVETFYDSHELYTQSTNKVLHHIEITWKEDEFSVHRVIGLEHREEKGHENYRRIFDRAPIALTEKTQDILREKIIPHKENGCFSFSILGKLEAKQTAAERGNRVLYSYVVPSLDQLPDNSIVLLQATGLQELPTDLKLELSYPYDDQFPFIDELYHENQLSRVWMLRRQFSAREDRLSQVADTIKGTFIPVALWKPKDQKENSFRGVIIHDEIMIPLRRPELLDHLLEQGVILGLVAKEFHKIHNNLLLELYPAIFIKVDLNKEPDKYELHLPDSFLFKGDKVLLTRTDGGTISIKLAATGHRNFISNQPRPSVILPHNKLCWPFPKQSKRDGELIEDAFKILNETFLASLKAIASVGGLPDINALPGGSVKREKLLEWMMGKHPKFAVVVRERSKAIHTEKISYFPIITQIAGDWLVGTLDLTFGLHAIRVRQWDFTAGREPEQALSQTVYHSLDWQKATFCDEPVKAIKKRIEKSQWRYHDRLTAYWISKSSEEKERLYYHEQILSPNAGPLFFQLIGNDARLKYTPDVLWKFAFPVDEVLNILRSKSDQEEKLTVACAEHHRLWVEIAPGRVAELPGAMCCRKPSKSAEAISLENYNWSTFAPGDHIRLRLSKGGTATDGNFALERFLIIDWECGPRQALNSKEGSSFLPILEYNTEEGSITLGGGQFKLTVPASEPIQGKVAFQLANDSFRSSNGRKLSPGDVVLLELAENEQFRIAGFPEYSPQPINKNENEAFTNTNSIFKIMTVNYKLREFLRAIGNFLPVTVVDSSNDKLIFDVSSERQAAELSPGTISEAKVCGWLHSLNKAVLRIGSKFHVAGLCEFIKGIPNNNHQIIANFLIESQVSIWIRIDPCGIIQYELPAKYLIEDFEVETATKVIYQTQETSEKKPLCGVICRNTKSGGLAWLSIAQATLAKNITPYEWQAVLDNQIMKKMRACYLENSSISLIKVKSVEKAFDMYRPGRELPVHLIAPEEVMGTGCLAWSDNLNAIVRVIGCDNFDQGTILLVEIIERRRAEEILILSVTPRGQRRWKINFPGGQSEPENPKSTSSVPGVLESSSESTAPNFQRPYSHLIARFMNLDDTIKTIISFAYEKKSNDAVRVLQDLGINALCSLHLEIIATYWWNNIDNRERYDGEWHRLHEMIEELSLTVSDSGLDAAQLRKLKDVLRAVDLKTIIPENGEPPIILVLSAALAVAAGIKIEPEQFLLMWSSCEILNEIIPRFRSYPFCHDSKTVGLFLEEHKKVFETIRKKLIANLLEIKINRGSMPLT